MRNLILTLCISITAASVFAAGDSEIVEAEKSVIRYAYQWSGNFDQQMKAYAESVKDEFILELELTPGLDHKQKIQVEAAAGLLPEVFQYWSYETNLKNFAENGIILDVDDYMSASDAVSRDDFSSGAWSAVEVNGARYGFPVSSFKGFFLANKALFDQYGLELPDTWADLKTVSEVLRENDIIPLSMGSLNGDPGHLFFSALAYQAADGYTDAQNIAVTGNFNTEAHKRAADAVVNLIEWKTIPSDTVTNGGWGPQTALYNSRLAAMIFSFPWKIGDFDTDVAADSVIIPVPAVPGAEVDPGRFTVGGISISNLINKAAFDDPLKQANVTKLVDYLVSDKVYTDVALNGKGFPAKIIELEEGENTHPLFSIVQDFTARQDIYGIHEFFFPNLVSFDKYKSACDELYAGALTPEEFLSKVQNGL